MEREVLENAFAQALDELNAVKKSISEQSYLIKKLMEKSRDLMKNWNNTNKK